MQKTNLIRSFVAIPLSAEIHHNLAVFSARYKLDARELGLRPVKPENIHLTLKFLGEIEPGSAVAVSQALASAVKQCEPFTFTVQSLGAFPGWNKNPRVIWVGAHPLEKIQPVFQRVESALRALGFAAEERRFSPHLTLSRVKQDYHSPARDALFERLINLKPAPEFGQFTATEVVFFQSQLNPDGPVYTVLSRHAFSG